MNWESNLVALAIVASAIYLGFSAWRTLFAKSKAGCGSGCGKCAEAPTPQPTGRRPLPTV